MRKIPVMCNPKMITTIPPILATQVRKSYNTPPKADAATPKRIKTTLKPSTKANPWLKVTHRLGASDFADETVLPPKYPTYAGTSEKTHGERNEAKPAKNASPRVMFEMTILEILLLAKLFTPPKPSLWLEEYPCPYYKDLQGHNRLVDEPNGKPILRLQGLHSHNHETSVPHQSYYAKT